MAITVEERQFAQDLLQGSHAALETLLQGLSDAHWQASAGGWTVSAIVEHLWVVEMGIGRRIRTMPPPDEPRPDRDRKIVAAIRDRSVKVDAPEAVVPQGRTTGASELMAKLAAVRQKSLEWLADPVADHRAHAMEHPFLRTLDGYQWMLMLGAHMERHTAQIREILAATDTGQTA
jgi:hypothetical protein